MSTDTIQSSPAADLRRSSDSDADGKCRICGAERTWVCDRVVHREQGSEITVGVESAPRELLSTDTIPRQSIATVERAMNSYESGECWWCGAEPMDQCDHSLHTQVGKPLCGGKQTLPVEGDLVEQEDLLEDAVFEQFPLEDLSIDQRAVMGDLILDRRTLRRRVRVAHMALGTVVFGYPRTLESAIHRVLQDLEQMSRRVVAAESALEQCRKNSSSVAQELVAFKDQVISDYEGMLRTRRDQVRDLRQEVSGLRTELSEFAAAVSEHECSVEEVPDVTMAETPRARRRRATGSTAEIPVQSMAQEVWGESGDQNSGSSS